MKKVILLSGPDKTKYFSKRLTQIIKSKCNNPHNMVVIPADANNIKKNDKQFNGNEEVVGVYKNFKKLYPELENIILLDSRIDSKKGKDYLKNADIIYLLGGDPFIQLKYLRDNGYDDIICNTNALLMGVSAGSMNLSKDSYYSKDEDYKESIIYKGLGITSITIDPHFYKSNKEQVEEIKKYSKDRRIIGLPNRSIIVIDKDIKYIGRVYIYENGNLIKI